jgi:methylated-DNA-[protein]-cysteine S-methyltransferase
MSQECDQLCATVFKSSLGWFGVVWRGQAVSRLTFGHRTRKEAADDLGEKLRAVAPEACPDPSLVTRLQDYGDGTADDFSDVLVGTEHLTPFGRRVVKACRGIPYGGTASYGTLAQKAGSPKAARAVGQCMASNRVPLIVPCHRVVAASGRLGGFSAPGGVDVKRRLLDLESS